MFAPKLFKLLFEVDRFRAMPVPVDSLTIFSFPRTSDYIYRLSPNLFRIAVGPFGSLQACAYCIHFFVAARSAGIDPRHLAIPSCLMMESSVMSLQ